ncbi:MAG: hypothetical protein KC643_00505, partial [Nitrospira sp.]|nr:hypothetical protein [Nitrospira sp.]
SHSAPEKPLTHVVPKGKAEERDLIILLLQGRLEADHLAHLEEEKFTVELYREIVRHVEVHREASGLVDVESLRGDLTSDPVFESAVSQLCVWEMQLENQAEHIQGCLRTLEGKWLQRILEGVTTRLKTAEREGRQEEVDRLNAEINALLGRKAVLMAS